MNFFRLLFLPILAGALALTFSGCGSLGKKKPKLKPDTASMEDQNKDTSFQGFLTRLRKAVDKHDMRMLATVMSPNFGYSWEPGGEGPGVFEYWNRNNLWDEVGVVLRSKFVPHGNYMVAPAQVTFDADYKGYRAGLRQINGSWRFCYFVPAPPAASQSSEAAPAPLPQVRHSYP